MKKNKPNKVLIQEKVDLGNGRYKYGFTTEDGYHVGESVYVLNIAQGRTKAQNDLFWSAMRELYNSGAYSFLNIRENPNYPMTFRHFSEAVKLEHGAGVEYYFWKTKDGYRGISDEPPEGDFVYIEPVPKSTTKYTKEEFSALIDNVKAWVREMGDIPEKVFQILHMIDEI